jgi:hypothetical protein
MTVRALGIHDFSWRRFYLRYGGHFIITAMWQLWGVEVCRCPVNEPWSKWGSVSRQVGVRVGGYRLWIFLGKLRGLTAPDLSNRRLRLVTNRDIP